MMILIKPVSPRISAIFRHLDTRRHLPTVEHLHLTLVPVDTLVGAADQLLLLPLAVCRTGLASGGTLLGNAERHGDFEYVLSGTGIRRLYCEPKINKRWFSVKAQN